MRCVKSGNIVTMSGYVFPNKINQNLNVLKLPIVPMTHIQIIIQYGNGSDTTFGSLTSTNDISINVKEANVAHRFNFSYVQKS